MLGTAIQETQIQTKPERESVPGKRKTQGLVKAKAARLLSGLAGVTIDSGTEGNIFSERMD